MSEQRERFWDPEESRRRRETVVQVGEGEEETEEPVGVVMAHSELERQRLGEEEEGQKTTTVKTVAAKSTAIGERGRGSTTTEGRQMLTIYEYSCPKGHRVESYHPVSRIADLEKICQKCNPESFKRRRVSRGTYKNEFAFEFVVAPEHEVVYDDYGSAMPVDETKKRTRIRELVQVRKKWFALGKTIVVKTTIDATDQEFANMCILSTYLVKHNRRVGWSDTSKNPIPARNEDGTPYTPSFEYHPDPGDDE
jgi:hypothetical protein